MAIPFLLFFVSGLSALLYEVLWLKDLGLLFGNTSYAASTTLAAFFAGLSAGGAFWGRRSARFKNPLLAYSALELGVALFALVYVVLSRGYTVAFPTAFSALQNHRDLLLFTRFVMAATLLFPPAFFMGGTLPVMSQYLVTREELLGRTGTLLYAVNTMGAVFGAFLAGFYLPLALGYRASYLLAVSLNAGIALAAFALGRATPSYPRDIQPPPEPVDTHEPAPSAALLDPRLALGIALGSGLASLSLEVLWTQMFKQVTQNTVYSFSLVLVTFLLAMALGSLLAHYLCRRTRVNSFAVLSALLGASGVTVAMSPWLFYRLTDGLQQIFLSSGWQHYNFSVFGIASLIILLPGIFVGAVLPYLLKVSPVRHGAGKTIGTIVSVNTVGSIAGSVGAGFALIPYAGLWLSVKLVAGAYIVMAFCVADRLTVKRFLFRAVACVSLIALSTSIFPSSTPVVTSPDDVVEVWQGSYGNVSVHRLPGDELWMRVNNHYSIGSTAGAVAEQLQTEIPLLLHPDPVDVFFIGMGTGLTAGAALKFPVRHVDVCELIPEVAQAAQKYFGQHTGLFTDPRASVVIEDGRNYLLASDKKYDVIVQDFFNPYDAGTGSLYTIEHLRSVRSHLKRGGIFAQWVGLFQVSAQEFSIIAKTMLEVFPNVTLWRLPSPPDRQLAGLIAYDEPASLDPAQVKTRVARFFDAAQHYATPDVIDEMPYMFYVGNLSAQRELFKSYPTNTEDRPSIEYLAPISQQMIRAKLVPSMAGLQFAALYDRLRQNVPPEEDPYLIHLDATQVRYVRAALHSFKTILYRDHGMLREAQLNYMQFLSEHPSRGTVRTASEEK
jgi:spermidine synthase